MSGGVFSHDRRAPPAAEAAGLDGAVVRPAERAPRSTLPELATLFLKLGATAFGGPAAHIAMMEDEVVRRRGWLSREDFLDLLGATNLIPGPNSTEMAIHVGHRRAGWPGLVVAGLCFVLPAAVAQWRMPMLTSSAAVAGAALAIGLAAGWLAGRASGQPGAPPAPAPPNGGPAWIRGSTAERFAQVEKHLRGLDVGMAEIGYRYSELFFAVKDRNWDYADYLLGKIQLVLDLAVERRPKRGKSARAFLQDELPAVQAGIDHRHLLLQP
jgi:hypothetical protein